MNPNMVRNESTKLKRLDRAKEKSKREKVNRVADKYKEALLQESTASEMPIAQMKETMSKNYKPSTSLAAKTSLDDSSKSKIAVGKKFSFRNNGNTI